MQGLMANHLQPALQGPKCVDNLYQLFYCTTWGLSNTDMFHNNPEDCIIYLSVNPTYLSVLFFYFFIYFFLDPTYLYLDLDLS